MDTKPSRSKPLGFLVVVGLVALVLVLDMRRRAAEDQLAQLSVKLNQVNGGGNEEENKAAAKAIVERVRKLINIPTDIEPTVATIVDVEKLREKNAFYAKAENGDNLIITKDRAILYSPTKNVIIDVVPVQIQAPPSAEGTTTSVAASKAASSKAASVAASSAAASVAATSSAAAQ